MSEGQPGGRVVRVFVSSPGDVTSERQVALAVIKSIARRFRDHLTVRPILWEYEPLEATSPFQAEIDRRAPPSASDIAVFILWSRLGTPLSDDFVLEDGRRPTGTEWEFEDASRASRSNSQPHLLVYRKTAEIQLSLNRTSREDRERSEAQFAAIEAFFQRNFQDDRNLSFTGSYSVFEDVDEFSTLLEEHLTRLLRERAFGGRSADAVLWSESPFRGLEVFDERHAPIFFGRTRATHEVLLALRRQVENERGFVLVVGPSGSGKSSLVRAGVLPVLDDPGAIDASCEGGILRKAVFTPGHADTPLAALAQALRAGSVFGALGDLPAGAVESALAEPTSAVALVRGAADALAREARLEHGLEEDPEVRLLLVVDQMEELFTREGVGELERAAFEAVLVALARQAGVWVIATLRSDFYARISEYPALMGLKQVDGHYDLRPPDPALEIPLIVRRPAEVAGLVFEHDEEAHLGLDDKLIQEAGESAEILPLLEFALSLLYEERDGGMLTYAAYERIGGIRGALSRHANEVFEGLSPRAQRSLPQVLRMLLEVSQTGTPTRRRAVTSEVAPNSAARELVRAFLDARLLVSDRGQGDVRVLSLAHEALVTHWTLATELIEEERELLRIRSRLRTEAAEWEAEGRHPDWLLGGRKLDAAGRLVAEGFRLTPTEQEFLEKSRRVTRHRSLETYEVELDIAAQIQRASLPGTDTETIAGMTVAARWIGANQVTGDLIHFQELDSDRLVLAVGDVAGSGIGPALQMATVRGVMKSFIEAGRGLTEVVEAMNRTMAQEFEAGSFITVALAIWDRTTQTIRYSNCGNIPPLLLRQGETTPLMTTTPALGFIDDLVGKAESVVLERGDMLFFTSDGIIEARSPDGELFDDRFAEAVVRLSKTKSDPGVIAQTILDEVSAFREVGHFDDDVTLLVARVD